MKGRIEDMEGIKRNLYQVERSLVGVGDALSGDVANFAFQILVPDGTNITVTTGEVLDTIYLFAERTVFKVKNVIYTPELANRLGFVGAGYLGQCFL